MNGMKWKYKVAISIFSLLIIIVTLHSVSACKDIVACGNATKGAYNLFLKVRDPSRPGYQVLTLVPQGYSYTYHHPWTGRNLSFQVNHSFIGVASVGDTIPQPVKAGMCFTSAGLAFGDADATSNWKNPTQHAWDDFDWIRYACQTADDEEEAVSLLTEEAVDQLHASGVPENLFVVGPQKGYVIEADMLHYDITEVNDDVVVMSNYVKNLWRKSFFLRLIAPSFNTTFQGNVQEGQVIRLGNTCLFGIKIIAIEPDFIEVKQVPIQYRKDTIIGRVFDLFSTTKIQVTNAETIGFYRVKLQNITQDAASILMCYEYYAWEEKMKDIIQPFIGNITVSTMMQWSRLHEHDLDGLRGMCDNYEIFPYEGDMIYKIPKTRYVTISEGWFSANHPCSTIYVPVHICDTDFYDPYETGEAAALSLHLLETYGHNVLTEPFQDVEQVFINELANLELVMYELVDQNQNISSFLTTVDVNMQKQAFLTQKLWMNASKMPGNEKIVSLLSTLWHKNYSKSLENMESLMITNQPIKNRESVKNDIMRIALSIVEMRLKLLEHDSINQNTFQNALVKAKTLLSKGQYNLGFSQLRSIISKTNHYFLSSTNASTNHEHVFQEVIHIPIFIFAFIIPCCTSVYKLNNRKFII